MRYALVVPAILAACATAAPLPSPEDVIDSTVDTVTSAVDTDTITDVQKDITNAVDEATSSLPLDALNLKRDTEDAIDLGVGLNGNNILTRDTEDAIDLGVGLNGNNILTRDTEDAIDLGVGLNGNNILTRDTENAMDGIDTAVDANVDVLKRAEDLTIDSLTLHNLDVPPNLNLQNVARSEDVSIDSIDTPVGVPTLLILRRGDGNGEVVSDNGDGLLGGLLNLKRDNEILTNGNGNNALGLGISLKRDDAILTDGDETNDGGLLNIPKAKRDDTLTSDNELLDIGKLLKAKRDDALPNGDGDKSSLLGITIPVKRDNAFTNAKSDNKPLDIALKRDTSELIDTDQIGDDSLLGFLKTKREEDTFVGGIGGVDVGTPILDAVNV